MKRAKSIKGDHRQTKRKPGVFHGAQARGSATNAVVKAVERKLAAKEEKKNIDVSQSAGTSFPFGTSTAVVTLLNGIAQGVTALTRLGRRIHMKSLYIRYHVAMGPTSTGSSPLRLLVVYDKQPNAASPAAVDILTADNISSPNNLSNSRRFVTIFDDVIECIGTGGPQADYQVLYKKLNLDVEFNTGSTGTISDITTGSLIMLTYTNGNIGVASPIGNIYTRVRFTDA